MSALVFAALSSPANAAERPPEKPDHTVSISTGSWGYRQGIGTRVRVLDNVSLTTALDPFRWNVGFVSHTGAEAHADGWVLGRSGFLQPTLGIGAYATGGASPLHRNPIPSAGLYAAPGVRWYGARGKSATLLGVTIRLNLQGEQPLDTFALTLGFEWGLGKRKARGPDPLPAFDDLPEAL